MIAVFGEKKKDVYEAADYVRDVGEATGEYEGRDLEDWPWDNGTARVLVDGCHVTEDEE